MLHHRRLEIVVESRREGEIACIGPVPIDSASLTPGNVHHVQTVEQILRRRDRIDVDGIQIVREPGDLGRCFFAGWARRPSLLLLPSC